MNDEIKEILHNIKECCDINKDENWVVYQKDRIYQLLDYITNLQKTNKNHSKKLIELGDKITNLQQENETRQQDINNLTYQLAKMKEENERLKEDLKGQEKLTLSYCKSEQDYKSRCEKASEILKKLDLDKYTYTKENRKHTINDLLNTLQNGSDSQ